MMFDEKYINDWSKMWDALGWDSLDTDPDFWTRFNISKVNSDVNVGKSESKIVYHGTYTTISTDLPGYKKEGIKISSTAKVITVVVEGVRGKKTYTYKLNETADFQKISSKFEDAVLVITVPQKAETLPVEIKVD